MDVGFESIRGYHCSTWNERRVVSLQRGMESSMGIGIHAGSRFLLVRKLMGFRTKTKAHKNNGLYVR
jgi:hypothetical protein